ncbi:hypothetical protein FRX31_010391 [Thalictrum thalictroides]|uniref:Uncharacterized protein n=1 Tax=Thalictrum thalictroides TaxID=46969 RepID=A0A7J6WRN9_THATH|nr:hypothetical protein FRX31_010391 [Thalictrum thalictroides]
MKIIVVVGDAAAKLFTILAIQVYNASTALKTVYNYSGCRRCSKTCSHAKLVAIQVHAESSTWATLFKTDCGTFRTRFGNSTVNDNFHITIYRPPFDLYTHCYLVIQL